MRNIRQNLFFAFVYNAAGVPIAAGVLYPVFGILLSPIIAAAAMALSLGQRDRQCAAAAAPEALGRKCAETEVAFALICARRGMEIVGKSCC